MILLSHFIISGHSMEPVLKEKDSVLVSSLPFLFSKPKTGDVIAFKSPIDNKVLIKRITKVEGNNYFLQGDNHSDSTDSRKFGMIDKKDIIGKVVYFIRN